MRRAGAGAGSVFESVVATDATRPSAADFSAGTGTLMPSCGIETPTAAADARPLPPSPSTASERQQPKHTSSGSTRPPFRESSVLHAEPGVSPTPVDAVTRAKK